MLITRREENEALVIVVEGSMDATTVDDFNAEWSRATAEGVRGLVVDMTGVEYISSAGLRGILMLAKTAKSKNIPLAFAGMRDMVADMFRLSGFMNILAVHADTTSALAALRA